jgi:transposase
MRTKGSASELQRFRVLAVEHVLDGDSASEVAAFLNVSAATVRRWVASYRRSGLDGLMAKAVPGRPPKLTRAQEKITLHWLDDPASKHGFDTELWTGARLAELIWVEWQIELNPRYICRWLRARGFTPQRPQRIPRERDLEVIAAWLQGEWTRLKKKRRVNAEPLFSLTKVGF